MQKKVSLYGPDHPDFILDDYPLYNLNRTSATYTQQTTERLKSLDMDQPSWRVLMLLGDKNPSTVGELSRRSVTKISTITRILIRMENDGLITRKPFPEDNRVIEVFITSKGTEMLLGLRSLASDVYKKAFIGVKDEDIVKFTNILMKIRQNLSE